MKDTELDDFLACLRTPELRNLAQFFWRNLNRATYVRSMHFRLIFPRISERRESEVIKQILDDDDFPFKRIWASGRFTSEFWDEVKRRMMQAGKEAIVDDLVRGARAHLDSLSAEDPRYGVWLRALQQSGTMALWSAFESLASDLWVYAVNSRPDLFGARVLREFSESLQPQGFSSRSIPIGIAAKYQFDLRNHIGDIVADVIDFTSMSDVKKAYMSAFGLDEQGQELLQNEQLKKLVLIRNLIAHRSGVVDAEFKERTGCSDNIGDELTIDDELAERLMDAVKIAGLYLLRMVDRRLAESTSGSNELA